MALEWTESLNSIDWRELSELYRLAPLGEKPPDYLKCIFTNSMFRSFTLEEGRLIEAGRALADGGDCS